MDGLEEELKDRLVVVRLNIQNAAHKDLVEAYRVRGTPTFILLDAKGSETWRTIGALNAEEIRQRITAP